MLGPLSKIELPLKILKFVGIVFVIFFYFDLFLIFLFKRKTMKVKCKIEVK